MSPCRLVLLACCLALAAGLGAAPVSAARLQLASKLGGEASAAAAAAAAAGAAERELATAAAPDMLQLIARGAVTASSEYDSHHSVRLSALRCSTMPGGSTQAWSSKHNDAHQWIEVDLGAPMRVNAIKTQGRADHDQWVTSYRIAYRSRRGQTWKQVPEPLDGNRDRNNIVTHVLRGVRARYVRLLPVTWLGHISLRWDVLAGDRGMELLRPAQSMADLIFRGSVRTSSEWDANHSDRQSALLSPSSPGGSGTSWCAKVNDAHQWIEVDLGTEQDINAVQTQGRGNYDQWVTAYRLAFRNRRGESWKEVPGIFKGNHNRDTIVTHELHAVHARFLRLIPVTWYGHISLRWDVLSGSRGARYTKSALPGASSSATSQAGEDESAEEEAEEEAEKE